MSLHDDLLEQAFSLANTGQGRPKQASLRRAVSTAYYALFHLLVSESSRMVVTGTPELQNLVGRAYQHNKMKDASQAFSMNTPPQHLQSVCSNILSPDLQVVAGTFVSLQEERHEADYNTNQRFKKNDVLLLLEKTRIAFASWEKVRKNADTKVYLMSLLLGRKWR